MASIMLIFWTGMGKKDKIKIRENILVVMENTGLILPEVHSRI